MSYADLSRCASTSLALDIHGLLRSEGGSETESVEVQATTLFLLV